MEAGPYLNAGAEGRLEPEIGERGQILLSLLRAEGTAGQTAYLTEQSRYELGRIHHVILSCHTQLVNISRVVCLVALCVVMLTFTTCMIAMK